MFLNSNSWRHPPFQDGAGQILEQLLGGAYCRTPRHILCGEPHKQTVATKDNSSRTVYTGVVTRGTVFDRYDA